MVGFRSERVVGEGQETIVPYLQFLLVLHGSADLLVGESVLPLASGDVLLVRPGITHRIAQAHALQLIRCRVEARELIRKLGEALDSKSTTVLLHSSEAHRYPVPADRFRTIAATLGAAVGHGEMGAVGRLLLLLETIVEAGEDKIPTTHPAVFGIVSDFDGDLTHDWTLPGVAASRDLDPSYVARLFKSSLGIPPLAYLALMRAEEAASLLFESKLPCSSVGDKVGWKDPNYFSRRFRQHFGESPTTFRDRASFKAA